MHFPNNILVWNYWYYIHDFFTTYPFLLFGYFTLQGTASTKHNEFTLSSGDFPTLGSETNSELHARRGFLVLLVSIYLLVNRFFSLYASEVTVIGVMFWMSLYYSKCLNLLYLFSLCQLMKKLLVYPPHFYNYMYINSSILITLQWPCLLWHSQIMAEMITQFLFGIILRFFFLNDNGKLIKHILTHGHNFLLNLDKYDWWVL